MTIDHCCYCSHFRATHPELPEDVIVVATVLHSAPQKDRKYRDGKYRVIGCPHIRPAFGPHRTNECAQIAIRDTFSALREQRARETARIDELIYGRNQVQIEAGANRETQSSARKVPSETARGSCAVSEDVAPDAQGLSSDDDAPVEVTAMCEVGSSVWLNHDRGLDDICKRCHAPMPALKI